MLPIDILIDWRQNKKLTTIGYTVYICEILVILLGFMYVFNVYQVRETNSYFSSDKRVTGNSVSAGYWLPELDYKVSPTNPDGKNGWYKTHPCVSLEINLEGSNNQIKIYYEYSHDGNPVQGGEVYSGSCVSIPDGEWDFQAQAVNKKGDNEWKSNLMSLHFKVDTTKPCKPIWHFPKIHRCHNLETCMKNFWDDYFVWNDKIDDQSGIMNYIFEEKKPGENTEWQEPFSTCSLIKNNIFPSNENCFSKEIPDDRLENGNYQRRVKVIDNAGNESDWSNIWTFSVLIDEQKENSEGEKETTNHSAKNIDAVNNEDQNESQKNTETNTTNESELTTTENQDNSLPEPEAPKTEEFSVETIPNIKSNLNSKSDVDVIIKDISIRKTGKNRLKFSFKMPDNSVGLNIKLYYRKDGGNWQVLGVSSSDKFKWGKSFSKGVYEFYSVIEGDNKSISDNNQPEARVTFSKGKAKIIILDESRTQKAKVKKKSKINLNVSGSKLVY